jgi:hypothetical protein
MTERTTPIKRRQKRSRTPPKAARAEAIGIKVSGPRYIGANHSEVGKTAIS